MKDWTWLTKLIENKLHPEREQEALIRRVLMLDDHNEIDRQKTDGATRNWRTWRTL